MALGGATGGGGGGGAITGLPIEEPEPEIVLIPEPEIVLIAGGFADFKGSKSSKKLCEFTLTWLFEGCWWCMDNWAKSRPYSLSKSSEEFEWKGLVFGAARRCNGL